MEIKLRDYQRYCVEIMKKEDTQALLLPMGSGKTLITLTAIDEKGLKKTVIIAPKRVALTVWGYEIDKWGLDLPYVVIKGNPKQRDKLYHEAINDENIKVVIVSISNIDWLYKVLSKETVIPFDSIIFDELSLFKYHSTERFKMMKVIIQYIPIRYGLTGTPTPKGYINLFSQMYLMDLGERLGKYVTQFRDKYFYVSKMKGNVPIEYTLKTWAKEAIEGKIKDKCISLQSLSQELMNFEPPYFNYIFVDIPKDKYNRMIKQHIIMEDDIVGDSAVKRRSKLLQMANGQVYDENRNVIEIHDEKINALKEIIETSQSPVFILYNYLHDRDRIMKSIKGIKILDQDPETINSWNRGEIDVMLSHPASCGHGINLQEGGHTMVWYGLTDSLELYQQTNARLARSGQKYKVTIHHILARDTVEEVVKSALDKKDTTQQDLLRAMDSYISKIKGGK